MTSNDKLEEALHLIKQEEYCRGLNEGLSRVLFWTTAIPSFITKKDLIDGLIKEGEILKNKILKNV